MEPNHDLPSLPPPMWYPDPSDANRLRWWDGSKWTDPYAQIPAPEAAVSAAPALSVTHNPSPITDYTLQPTPKAAMPARERTGAPHLH